MGIRDSFKRNEFSTIDEHRVDNRVQFRQNGSQHQPVHFLLVAVGCFGVLLVLFRGSILIVFPPTGPRAGGT